MKVTPITGALGAEIDGIDLTDLSAASLSEIDELFARHLVLCFRNQSLTPASLLELTHKLGGPGETPYLGGMPDYPDVVPVIKEANERSHLTFGAGWHTDFTFQPQPPDKTLLYAVDTPPAGGDTLYCNLYDAFDALSPGMQQMLTPMKAVHSAVRSYGPKATLKDHIENMEITNDKQEPEKKLHPVIRAHPVTGKPALWVNPTYTIKFEKMTEDESAPLLNYLNQLAIRPSFTCRVQWAPGTLTIWDNRCTQHCATSDYAGHRRECWRTTVAGGTPVGYSLASKKAAA